MSRKLDAAPAEALGHEVRKRGGQSELQIPPR